MKLIGNLLMIVGLIAGCLAAATAYSARTSLSNERLIGLTMSADAGARQLTAAELAQLDAQYEAGEITAERFIVRREALAPIVPARVDGAQRVIDEQTLEKLRVAPGAEAGESAGVDMPEFVKVKEFGLLRWPFWWMFMASAGGLGAGALMVRTATKRALRASVLSQPGGKAVGSPTALLEEVRRTVSGLLNEMPAMPSEEARLEAIVERLGAVQRNELAAFAEARQALIARLSMSGFAGLMDRFATAERRLNRAWSAAADGVFEEAFVSLQSSVAPLEEAIERLHEKQ